VGYLFVIGLPALGCGIVPVVALKVAIIEMNPRSNHKPGPTSASALCATTLIVALGGWLFLATSARAQSDDGAAIAAAPADDISAVADDASAAAGYTTIDDSADDGSGQVLELPQRIDPANPQTADTEGDADTGNMPQDQLGDVNQYESQTAGAELNAYPGGIVGVPVGLIAMPRTSIPAVTGYLRTPASPFIARPGGLGPFLATSPMLSHSPRGGSIPGGWWTRTHR
jgi:hypothetical protein